jgi:drug/metabolite transporter (DMT)-like permease
LAFTFTTAGVSTLLANVSVVFVGIGGWLLLREKLDWRWAAGACLAMSGVGALAIMTQASTSAPDPLRGNVLSLGTALCYAGYLLSAKVLRRATPTSIIMLSVVTGAPLVLLVGMLVTGEQFLPKTADAWLWLILLAIVPQSLGQGLVIWGLRSLPASFGAVVLLIQPVATTVWGSLMLGELLSAWDIGFGMLVLGGIVLARFGTHEPQATTLQPCNTPNSNCKV